MPHHLILNKVEFYPETKILKMTSDNRKISLFSSASRCLELLITRQGSIIPQRELMAFAWGDHGLSVSPNTFYQNISSLRKSLAELIPDEDIIITMKRSGLTIPKDIEITLVSEATIPSLPEIPTYFDEKKTAHVVNITNKSSDGGFHSLNHNNTSILSRKSFWVFMWFFIILLSATLLIKSYYFPVLHAKTLEDPFRHYTFYKKINANCSLFVNPDSGQIDPGNKLINISQSGCKGYDRVYVTLHEGTVTSSAMYCMLSNDTPSSCISEYVVRNLK